LVVPPQTNLLLSPPLPLQSAPSAQVTSTLAVPETLHFAVASHAMTQGPSHDALQSLPEHEQEPASVQAQSPPLHVTSEGDAVFSSSHPAESMSIRTKNKEINLIATPLGDVLLEGTLEDRIVPAQQPPNHCPRLRLRRRRGQ